LGRVAENYFATIFTIFNPSCFDQILHGIHRVVDEDENDAMGSEFLASEVQQALSQMAPLNTLGRDGMSPIFYKSFWHIVGEDVTFVVLKALNTGCVLESLNTTFISLIPKIKNLNLFIYFIYLFIFDFRPISLCNVIYKLIAKVVANHLKKFLAASIPNSQSAFLSGRLITDNILVAFETLHYLKRKTQGKLGYMALKLDMSKAYDRVK